MGVYSSVEEIIGKTPILELKKFGEGAAARIFAKLEYMNPAGSVKDRVALSMLDAAEKSGKIKPGATIIEPTSGNTGIGLCSIAAARGYKAIIVMPDSMSAERQRIMRAYGAKVVLTPGALGMKGAIAEAERLALETEGAFVPSQFENLANPEAHYKTTGPEIYEDMQTNIDIFVAGAGTGGTVSGVGRYLKEKNPEIKIVAVEPSDSPVLSGGAAGAHKLQGIGAGFVPKTLDRGVIDEVMCITADEAFSAKDEMARREGVLIGISSGAALAAAKKLAERPENKGKNIVVVMPDSGERYLS